MTHELSPTQLLCQRERYHNNYYNLLRSRETDLSCLVPSILHPRSYYPSSSTSSAFSTTSSTMSSSVVTECNTVLPRHHHSYLTANLFKKKLSDHPFAIERYHYEKDKI